MEKNRNACEQQRITYEKGTKIAEGLFPLAERREEVQTDLIAGGFSAFQSLQEWSEGYCQTDDELEITKRCRVEELKQSLWRSANPLPLLSDVQPELFESPFLSKLKRQRDLANGVAEDQLHLKYRRAEALIRMHYCPCDKNRGLAQQEDMAAYSRRLEAAQQNKYERFRQEAEEHASKLANSFGNTRTERCNLVQRLLEQYGRDCGFLREGRKTSKFIPAIVKKVNHLWDLRIIATETAFMGEAKEMLGRKTTKESVSSYPYITLEMTLCRNELPANIHRSGQAGEMMKLQYSLFVDGFFSSYRSFQCNRELDWIVLAHISLIKLVLPDFEEAIRTSFG